MYAANDEGASANVRKEESADESRRQHDRDDRMDTFMAQADQQTRRLSEREAQLARIELKLDEVLELLRQHR